MTDNLETIIERVQKLLALAGNNSNENEALAATAKAHAILAQHNLDMSEIEAHEAKGSMLEEEQRISDEAETNLSENYFGWIWGAVAKAHYCISYQCRPNPRKRRTYRTIVGRKINVIVAKQMSLYLCQTVRRLANEEAKRVGRDDHAFKNSFMAGCAARICQRVKEMKFGDVKQQNALTLWDDEENRHNREFLEQQGVRLGEARTTSARRYDHRGFLAGDAAGGKVSLNQQVGGAAAAPRAIA